MGEKFKEFPCYRFHRTHGQQRFENADELEAAGKGWVDSPTKLTAAAAPPPAAPPEAAPLAAVPPAAEVPPAANVEDEKQADVMPKKRDVQRMGKADLQALCTKLRIVWTAEMTNDQLRSAILEIIK